MPVAPIFQIIGKMFRFSCKTGKELAKWSGLGPVGREL